MNSSQALRVGIGGPVGSGKTALTEKLWQEVKPLYEQLARAEQAKLQEMQRAEEARRREMLETQEGR